MAKKKATTKRGRGRPAAAAPYRSVSVILQDEQVVWLDRLAIDIRSVTGAAINRAALIRGILSAVQQSGVDLTQATSEAEVQAMLAKKIKSK